MKGYDLSARQINPAIICLLIKVLVQEFSTNCPLSICSEKKRWANRMKSSFLFTLWGWAKVTKVDNSISLVGFLAWMGCR